MKTRKLYKASSPSLSLQERHKKYIQSLPIYDRILTKIEDSFKRNNIESSLISVVLIGIVFVIVFLFVIAYLSNHSTSTEHYFTLRSKGNLHHIINPMASSTIVSNNNIIKRIKILLISDIHLNKTNVGKVNKYLSTSNIKIDHLWAPGDFLKLKDEDNDDEKKLQQAENSLIDLLNDIKKIHPKPIIIPGNHDPKTLFSTENDKYFKFGECMNIHNKLYRVEGETNLFLAGFGGSVPAFCDSKLHWTGYPFSNDDEFGKIYNSFIDSIIDDKNNMIQTNKSIVLFTHNGPSMCSTTMDWRMNDENKIIKTGSINIMKSLLNDKLKDKLICNIHGHTHLGFGQGYVGNIKVINPGSLKGGDFNNNFAILQLAQFNDKSWNIDNVEFITLQ